VGLTMVFDPKGITMTTKRTFRVRRRPIDAVDTHSPTIRQWRLLEWLSSQQQGTTVDEAAEVFGVDLKTIRRDLIVLRRVGFDLVESTEDHGRKRWRIPQPFDRLRTKKQKYRSIRDTLNEVREQAEAIGDRRLAKDLDGLRKRVVRRCR